MKKTIIIFLFLILCVKLSAQRTDSQYLSLNVETGINELSYKLQNGDQTGNPDYSLNMGYSYFFTPEWGLQTGVRLQKLQSDGVLNYMSSTPSIDSQGDSYDLRTYYRNWRETQKAFLLNLPVGMVYKYRLDDKSGLLFSVGGALSVNLRNSYTATGGTIQLTGYYSQWNVELSDMLQHGFTTISSHFEGTIPLKPAYSAYSDFGWFYKIAEKCDLYVGGYMDYGVNNMITNYNKQVYQPNGMYNGMLESNQINSVRPVLFGIKIGLIWHLIRTSCHCEWN